MDHELRFWELVEYRNGCWEWLGWRSTGKYGGYGLYTFEGKQTRAHRIAWRLMRGPIPDGLEVLHNCDNPPCVRPAHLKIGTHRENILDAVRRGRVKPPIQPLNVVRYRGEERPNHKLTWRQVQKIRRLYARGKRLQLAKRYGVAHSTIIRIVSGRKWKSRKVLGRK